MASGLRPGAVDRGRLPVQPRDRRAALSALALLLVVAGALGSALVVYRSGHRSDVLVAAHEIKPGSVLTADDFGTARVATDTGDLIPASAVRNFIGTTAVTEIPAGTLLNRFFFLAGNAVPDNGVIVGITLPTDQRPAAALADGDIVRVYDIPKSLGGAAQPSAASPAANATASATGARVLVAAAKVVETSSGTNGDSVTVSLLLKDTDAPAVIQANAAGEIAVARLARTTPPVLDFKAAPTSTPAA